MLIICNDIVLFIINILCENICWKLCLKHNPSYSQLLNKELNSNYAFIE